jgi:hypothetical protein
MGVKHPDRIPIAEWRFGAETVAAMQAKEWDVISHCLKCGLTMPVDLDLIAWRSGAKTSLWNRRAPCRRIGCQGMVEFQGRPPGRSRHETLTAPWPGERR